MSGLLDGTRAVRTGEELDLERLEPLLRERIPDLGSPLVVEQFPRGHSNLTYLLRAGDRELVLRRPPFGAKIKSGHDMGREFRILSRLIEVYPKVPRPLAYWEDPAILGAPFYVMERVRGIILRARPPAGLELTPALMRRLSEAFIDNLADLHAVDIVSSGLAELGHGEGYIERQVTGWTERWARSKTDEVPAIEEAAAWLAGHQPKQAGSSLIHNDYKYDNVVLSPQDPAKILAVLDWEMATVGDPWMDLGTTLGYWVDPDDPQPLQALAFGPTLLPGNLNRLELAQRYAEKSGRPLGDLLFYFVFAQFKTAVIAQQIYARYKAGLTRDERFGSFLDAVRILGHTAVLALEKGRIDRLAV